MRGGFIFTQNDRVRATPQPDSVGIGDYNIDGHATQRVLLADGTVTNEGCLSGWSSTQPGRLRPFEIPFRVLLPAAAEATNLLVTCAVSATHVGSASLRLEPQYMNMGHAAGVAASLVAVGDAPSTQAVPIAKLQALLVQQGVRIGGSPQAPGFRCAPERCVASPGGNYSTNCDGRCRALGPAEWMASAGAWQLGDAVAVAVKDTHLKKSTAPSSALPPALVFAVAKGTRCNLSIDGAAVWDGLFFCSGPSAGDGAGAGATAYSGHVR